MLGSRLKRERIDFEEVGSRRGREGESEGGSEDEGPGRARRDALVEDF